MFEKRNQIKMNLFDEIEQEEEMLEENNYTKK